MLMTYCMNLPYNQMLICDTKEAYVAVCKLSEVLDLHYSANDWWFVEYMKNEKGRNCCFL